MTNVRGEESNGSGDSTTLAVGDAADVPNLPVPLSSFVGREEELGELSQELAGTRLLTVTGPGGCGKTRLVLRCASELSDRFPDGVWWVDLAPLAEERLVAATVAEALGVRPLPGFTELQAVCAYLASRRAMVVLDNCEHLLEACAEVVETLLQACPEIAVLATSRAPLGVAGRDRLAGSAPLSSGARGGPTGLADSDAVGLFVERAAQGAVPASPSPTRTSQSVAGLCRDLDGIPLAIELAAARAANALDGADLERSLRTASACSPAGRAPRWSATRPCGRPWTGATTCSPPRSRRCCVAWRCSRVVSPSRRLSRSAPVTDSSAIGCSTCSDRCSTSRS